MFAFNLLLIMANTLLPVPLNTFAAQQAHLESLISNDKRQTTLPVANPTTSFWQTEPLAGAHFSERIECNRDLLTDVNVCIIGSGITGVSAAYYHLAKACAAEGRAPNGLKAIILEAIEKPGSSVSKRSNSCYSAPLA